MAEETSAQASEPAPGGREGRGRLLIALGALLVFGAVVAVVSVAAGGGEDEGPAAAAPTECLRAWNGDRDALAFARHNSIFHNYNKAQVGYLSPAPDASVSDDPESGECAVVFARTKLDPEAQAAGQIVVDGVWTPLVDVSDINVVARLQSEAFEAANAEPTIDGEIVASQSTPEP